MAELMVAQYVKQQSTQEKDMNTHGYNAENLPEHTMDAYVRYGFRATVSLKAFLNPTFALAHEVAALRRESAWYGIACSTHNPWQMPGQALTTEVLSLEDALFHMRQQN